MSESPLVIGSGSLVQAQIRTAVFHVLPKVLSEEDAEMRIKMGTVVPKTGTIVHLEADVADYRSTIAMALRDELGSTHRAIKTAMRWTGASERTVKYWFAGERGPSGEHLIALVRNSDIVFHIVMMLADRCGDRDQPAG